MLALSCADTAAPEPDRLVTIEIRAVPDADTVRLADSIRFTVWADTLVPLGVRWVVEPAADTIVADTLVYRPAAAGTALVQAIAEFADGRVGIGARSVVTPLNHAPSGAIALAAPGNYTRVPLGDTLALVAAFTDPDGDSLDVEWFAGEPGSPGSRLLASGDTLRMPADTVGRYLVVVEVRDPAGARAVDRLSSEVYDPLTPVAWRVYAGSLGHLTSTAAGLIIGNFSAKSDGGNASCNCPLMAFDATGRRAWSLPSGSGAVPIPSVGDAVYFTDDTGTLHRVSGSGTVEWSLTGAVLGPVVLPDGSLVVPSAADFLAPRRLRRVSAAGTVVWDLADSTFGRWISAAAVGPDSAIYVLPISGTWIERTLVRLSPDGVVQWRLPLGGSAVTVADDSTILVTGDSIIAVRTPTGTVRWTRAQATAGAVVGLGGVGYTAWAGGGTTTLLAFQTGDGADIWQAVLDSAPGGVGVPVLLADGTAVLAVGAQLIAVDAATGTERWRHVLAGGADASPLVTDGGLLVVSSGNYLEALDVGLGPLVSPWPMEWGGNRRLGRRQTP